MNQSISEWVDTTIGEQCVVIAGQSPLGKFYNDTGTGLPFYQGKKEFGERVIGLPKKWTSHTTKEAVVDDILMSVRAPVGPINFCSQKICIGRGLAAIRVGDALDKDFLFYVLLSKQNEISGNEGAVFASINKAQIENIKLSLPPFSEQKRIVAILDEAFAGISQTVANAEKNLANACELFEGYLQEVFVNNLDGSQSVTLNGISDLIVDCEHKTAPTQETGYPSIRTPNIGRGLLILDKVKRVSEEVYKEWTRRAIPQADDLILAREAPAGNIAVIPKNIKVCLGQRTVLIRPQKDKVLSKYLAFLIISRDVQKQLLSHSTGATVEHINMKDIRAFKIYNLPALSKQQKIIDGIDAFSDETNKLEIIYQQKLTALTELKQSILQKAFAGELSMDMKTASSKTEEVNTTSPEFTAKILAFAYHRHAVNQRDKTYGHVKAQKVLHLIESIGGLNLGRVPIKDAAGPNDFKHMLRAEDWAKANQFFEFEKKESGKGYNFKKLNCYNEMLAEAMTTIKPYCKTLDSIIDLVLPMNSRKAEVFTTVHAAWNNLVLNEAEITDEAIIREAREDFHPDKIKIPVSEFNDAIRFIRNKNLIPTGKAKRVGGQQCMLLK